MEVFGHRVRQWESESRDAWRQGWEPAQMFKGILSAFRVSPPPLFPQAREFNSARQKTRLEKKFQDKSVTFFFGEPSINWAELELSWMT